MKSFGKISSFHIFSPKGQSSHGFSERNLLQTERFEEEAEGFVCWRARFGHGGADQGVVPTTHQTNIRC